MQAERREARLERRKDAVVGAGISGLAATHGLATLGSDVTVYESSPRLGSQVRTVEVVGLPVDVGAEERAARDVAAA